MSFIIGITGKIGSGKDTVAEILQQFFPEIENKKFSYKLKQVASLMTGFPIKYFEERQYRDVSLGDRWGMTFRQFMQKLGTEAIRDGLHKDAWVNALISGYGDGDQWVVTDVRFANELKAIQDAGGVVVRIVRPDNPYPQSDHESETALDHVELITIINDGTREQLELKIKEILLPIVHRIHPGHLGVGKYIPDCP